MGRKEMKGRWLRWMIVASLVCFALPAFGQIIGVNSVSGGAITNGGSAYSLTALENGSESLQAVVGTNTAPFYLVENDTGNNSSFSLTFTGTLSGAAPGSDQSLSCQNLGSATCSITGALGTVGTHQKYGPPPGLTATTWNPVATFTFNGISGSESSCPAGTAPAGTMCFEITFASFGNGASGTLGGAVPEGSDIAMLGASGLVLLGTLAVKRRFVP
jgi:hypothetical protein